MVLHFQWFAGVPDQVNTAGDNFLGNKSPKRLRSAQTSGLSNSMHHYVLPVLRIHGVEQYNQNQLHHHLFSGRRKKDLVQQLG